MPRISNLRESDLGVQRVALHELARTADVAMRERRQQHPWAVDLLYANCRDFASKLECETELAKFWKG